MKLLGIISVGFDVTDQLLIRFSAFGSPLWSSGQSSLLQIQGSRVRFPGTTKKKVMGLERGSLSLMSTTEELLDKKSSGSCLENREYGRRDPSR
jgi:hypothetical protein